MLSDVGCVVVHHRNYPGVLTTVSAILAAGVSAQQIILVDNSEDSELAATLKAELAPGIRLVTQANLGYGHAANTGVRALRSDRMRPEYILISTHEAVPESGAISAMLQVLRVSGCDVVGPTLISRGKGGDVTWSTGGELSRFLSIPFHTRLERGASSELSHPVERHWLDGAFCLYRADVLFSGGFREEYFLYFEEVDLHTEIRRAGGRILWTPAARVSQASSGIPAYYLTRNMCIFQSRYGNAFQRAVTPIYSLARFAIRACVKDKGIAPLRDLWRGFLDGRRFAEHHPV